MSSPEDLPVLPVLGKNKTRKGGHYTSTEHLIPGESRVSWVIKARDQLAMAVFLV